jgi:hypothetical protein
LEKKQKEERIRKGAACLQRHKGKQRKAQRKRRRLQQAKGKAPPKALQKPQKALQ